MRKAHSTCCLLRQVKDVRETKVGGEEALPNFVGVAFSPHCSRWLYALHAQFRDTTRRLAEVSATTSVKSALNQRIIYLSDYLLEATSDWAHFLAALLHLKYCSSKFFQINSSPSALSQDSF